MYTILADENIPFAREAFSRLGNVELISGRDITADRIKNIDILMVRSITKVNEQLLNGSGVTFVGTATIGTDHVDIDCLRQKGIGFSSAPGCNANSVSEYVIAALLEMAVKKGMVLSETTIGIIGVGNVGSTVEEKAKALGLEVILHDPPLKDKTDDNKYRPLDEIFDADIITLHVPLTREGLYPTFHMVDDAFLGRMGKGTCFINTSRGSVVDENALLFSMKNGEVLFSCLDVWEQEPDINTKLISLVDIATPHIAGYSFEGKVTGTDMVFKAAGEFLDISSEWDCSACFGEKSETECAFKGTFEENILSAVSINYNIYEDDSNVRNCAEQEDIGPCFDALRKSYRKRREFTNTVLAVSEATDTRVVETLEKIGFGIKVQEKN